METTYDVRDDLRAVIEQWVLTHVCPELAERGALSPETEAALASVAAPGTPRERRKLVADQLRELLYMNVPDDREVVRQLVQIMDPPWWVHDVADLPDCLIDALGLRRVVELARTNAVVLAALAAEHPKIAAMNEALDAIARVQDELAAHDWSPEAQRLMWAAAVAADAADLSVTISTSPDGLRMLILDAPEVLLNAPYRPGIDQGGYRVRDLDLRPIITEILALDASLPHDRDAVWPEGASERREALYVRAWNMARAAGWKVGVEHDPGDPVRPLVAVIVLPNGVQMRGHVRPGVLPEQDADVIPWDGRPRDLVGIVTWLVQER